MTVIFLTETSGSQQQLLPRGISGVWGFLCQAGMMTSYIFFERQSVTLILHICGNQTPGFENSLSFSSLLSLIGDCWSRTWWYLMMGRTRPIPVRHGDCLLQNTVCLSHCYVRFTFLKEEKVCFLSEQCLEQAADSACPFHPYPVHRNFPQCPYFSQWYSLVCSSRSASTPPEYNQKWARYWSLWVELKAIPTVLTNSSLPETRCARSDL